MAQPMTTTMTLDEARKAARARGQPAFEWNGETHLTDPLGPATSPMEWIGRQGMAAMPWLMPPGPEGQMTVPQRSSVGDVLGQVGGQTAGPVRSLDPAQQLGPPPGLWGLGQVDPRTGAIPVDVPSTIPVPPPIGLGGGTAVGVTPMGVGGPTVPMMLGDAASNARAMGIIEGTIPPATGSYANQMLPPTAPGVFPELTQVEPNFAPPLAPGVTPPDVGMGGAPAPGATPMTPPSMGGSAGPGGGDLGTMMAGQKALEPLMADPPATPEAQQQRVSAWKAFLEKFQSDPSWQAIALRLGVNMMQPIAPGQTAAGHLGNSILDAADFGAKTVDTELARRKEEQAVEQSRATTRQTDAETAQTIPAAADLATARANQTYAETITEEYLRGLKGDKLKQEIEKMKVEGILTKDHAELYKNQLEMFPKYREAVINELNARAQHHREVNQPRASGESNTFTHIQKLADSYLDDPRQVDIQEMKKTNPKAAAAMAYQKANEQAKMGMIQDTNLEEDLRSTVDNLWDEWSTMDEKAQKKYAGGFPAFVRSETEFDTYKEKGRAMLGKLARERAKAGTAPATTTPATAPGASKGSFKYDEKGNLVPVK